MQPKFDAMKEYLVALPLLGTTLAITFDVGYFHSIGAALFDVFTVSEHIAFAMQAVPLLVFASIVMILVSIIESYLKQETDKRDYVEGVLLFTLIIGSFFALVASSKFGFRYYTLNLAILCGVVSGVLILCIRLKVIPPIFEYNILVLGTATILVFLAFSVGRDFAGMQTSSRAPLFAVKVGDSREIRCRILRAGDRGLLVSDSGTKNISLISWEEIKEVAQVRKVNH